MIAVILDTNALHSDPWLTSEPGQKLLAMAAAGTCQVVFPDVVLEELQRQQQERIEKQRREATRLANDLNKIQANLNTQAASPFDIAATYDSLSRLASDNFKALKSAAGVTMAPLPESLSKDLLRRDLRRRRPFVETGADLLITGLRDVLIWESVLELLSREVPYTNAVFVTDDHGFLTKDKKQLHEHLVEDLGARRVITPVSKAKDVFGAIAKVRQLAPTSPEAARFATMLVSAGATLVTLEGSDLSLSLGPGGDYERPAFIDFEPPLIEEPVLDAIEQVTEFLPVDDGLAVEADVNLYISGFLHKSDVVSALQDSAEISEWSDHYYLARYEVAARARVTFDSSDQTLAVDDVILKTRKS